MKGANFGFTTLGERGVTAIGIATQKCKKMKWAS